MTKLILCQNSLPYTCTLYLCSLSKSTSVLLFYHILYSSFTNSAADQQVSQGFVSDLWGKPGYCFCRDSKRNVTDLNIFQPIKRWICQAAIAKAATHMDSVGFQKGMKNNCKDKVFKNICSSILRVMVFYTVKNISCNIFRVEVWQYIAILWPNS